MKFKKEKWVIIGCCDKKKIQYFYRRVTKASIAYGITIEKPKIVSLKNNINKN